MSQSHKMGLNDIRRAYLNYFTDKTRQHKQIPAAPLVLQEDPTTLFTSSGMQPLVPYLKGEPHPMGTRLVDSQPSFRAEDIDEVGDNRHTTFFEMLGNWSLGDYFKKEQIDWFFSFLYKVIELDPTRLYVTIFAGNDQVPRDSETEQIWKEQFNQVQKEFHAIGINSITTNLKPENGMDHSDRIFYYSTKKNWWSRAGVPENMPPGEIGGPDSEVFFDFDPNNDHHIHEHSAWKDRPCHPNCDCGRFLEIGNSVFMQYEKQSDGLFKELPKKNVDFGGGLERIVAAQNDNPDVFMIDIFKALNGVIEDFSEANYQDNVAAFRVIADHMRAATFMIAQGVRPSNKLQGYILRRLLRRSAVKLNELKVGLTSSHALSSVAEEVLRQYDGELGIDRSQVRDSVGEIINTEMGKFAKTLDKGLRVFNKHPLQDIDGKFAFDLFQTYGFPFEITQELAQQKGKKISRDSFVEQYDLHKQLSRKTSSGMFKGGLADHSKAIVKLHTATHLLHQALREELGNHVEQMGSNITAERLRFDFKHPAKLSEKEKRLIEQRINEMISKDLPVHHTVEEKDKALRSGALAFFREIYPNRVSVYTIGNDPHKDWYSKELCGGPHVSSTGKIGPVTIKKEQSIGAGTRRIYITFKSGSQ